MPHPTLSIVVTGRNDNYGGKLIARAQASLAVATHLAIKYKIQTEYIVVDYNPVPDVKYFFEELALPKNDYLTLRGIVVPAAFHDSIKKNKIPLLEYIGKNIGIRRAQGDYILATNPDIIFSDALFAKIAAGGLDEKHFYRADRYELGVDEFPEIMSPEEILARAPREVIKILYSPRTHYTSWSKWIDRLRGDPTRGNLTLCPLFNSFYPPDRTAIYENASGDFTMAHRSLWYAAHGYDQAPHNLHHDALMLYVFQALGYEQSILLEPIYHINHELGRAGRPGIEFAEFKKLAHEMQATKVPRIVNDASWGFAHEQFAEKVYGKNI